MNVPEALAMLQADPAGSSAGLWTNYLAVLVLLAAMLAGFYFVARFLAKKTGTLRNRGGTGNLELIDRLALEPRRTIYLVRSGRHYLTLASSEAGIQLLLERSEESRKEEV
jgi:hypothetical protein